MTEDLDPAIIEAQELWRQRKPRDAMLVLVKRIRALNDTIQELQRELGRDSVSEPDTEEEPRIFDLKSLLGKKEDRKQKRKNDQSSQSGDEELFISDAAGVRDWLRGFETGWKGDYEWIVRRKEILWLRFEQGETLHSLFRNVNRSTLPENWETSYPHPQIAALIFADELIKTGDVPLVTVRELAEEVDGINWDVLQHKPVLKLQSRISEALRTYEMEKRPFELSKEYWEAYWANLNAKTDDIRIMCPNCLEQYPLTEGEYQYTDYQPIDFDAPDWLDKARQPRPTLEQLNPEEYRLVCKQCGTEFRSEAVEIRAKRSRGNRSENRREFSIRAIVQERQLVELDVELDIGPIAVTEPSERLIEFTNSAYEDIELRSKDSVIFSYVGHDVRLIQNLTINKHWSIKPVRR